jgi:catechol 2,3-dioxygenase-like lactoylglutathione lyase family enzyme
LAKVKGIRPGEETKMSDSCAVTGLFHVLVKTNDLPQTLVFYKQVLGMREAKRPPFGFPGAWLCCSTPASDIIIHVWSGGPAFGPTGVSPYGTATIDHVSLTAIGHEGFRGRFKKYGLPWREFIIPETTLWQLFVYDPSGVQIELTFDSAGEAAPHGEIERAHLYTPGENFFDRETYPKL